MEALCPSFKRMADNAGVDEAFQKWLATQGVLNAVDYDTLAANESEVIAQVLDVAAADGVDVELLKKKLAAKKPWGTCSRAKTAALAVEKAEAAGGPAAVEADISLETVFDLSEKWLEHHNFVLPDNWLLVPLLQGRFWRGAQADPPRLDVTLIEGMRLMSSSERSMGNQFTIVPGRAIEANPVIADDVIHLHEMWTTIRA